MSAARPRSIALVAGAVGGAAAALAMIGWASVAADPVGRLGEALGFLAALVIAEAGTRAIGRIAPAFAERLAGAALLAIVEGGVAATGAYLLFARLRPGLLAARHAAAVAAAKASTAAGAAAELARLEAGRAQSLDPLYQAVSLGGLICFFGLLLGAYGAFRAQVARRYRMPVD